MKKYALFGLLILCSIYAMDRKGYPNRRMSRHHQINPFAAMIDQNDQNENNYDSMAPYHQYDELKLSPAYHDMRSSQPNGSGNSSDSIYGHAIAPTVVPTISRVGISNNDPYRHEISIFDGDRLVRKERMNPEDAGLVDISMIINPKISINGYIYTIQKDGRYLIKDGQIFSY